MAAHEEAVRLTPADHPARPAHLDNWASTLLSRWEATGNKDDLAHVIAIREALADSVTAGDPGRFLNNVRHFGPDGYVSRIEAVLDSYGW